MRRSISGSEFNRNGDPMDYFTKQQRIGSCSLCFEWDIWTEAVGWQRGGVDFEETEIVVTLSFSRRIELIVGMEEARDSTRS